MSQVNHSGWASTSKIVVPAEKANFGRIRLLYFDSNGPKSKLYIPLLKFLIIAIVCRNKEHILLNYSEGM